jgi:DNA-binding transcriptional LysR family regulator
MNDVHHPPLAGRLDLNLLRVFDAIARQRHLGRAAVQLHLSPSAVSHALARLRLQLGDPLFERHGRGIAPTALARRLAPEIHAALRQLDQALDRDRPFDPAADLPQLRLAMPDEMEAQFLPPLFERLRAHAPQLRVESVRLDRSRLKADLAAQRLDLVIDLTPLPDPEIGQRLLGRDPFCVLSGRGRRALDREAYLAAEHVIVSSRRSGLALEDLGLQRQGLQRRIALRCQLLEAACALVAESELLLTLPSRQAAPMLARAALRPHALPLELPEAEVYLSWYRLHETQPAQQWLRTELGALFST